MLIDEVKSYGLNKSKGTLKTNLSYWKQELAGTPPLLQFPADSSRSGNILPAKANFSFFVPKPLSDGLGNVRLKSETGLFVSLLAAFHVLLFRYTHEERILTGCYNFNLRGNLNATGKKSPQLNKLVFQTRLSDDLNFLDLAKRLEKKMHEAEVHMPVPFDSLIKLLRNEGINVNTLFQMSFEFCSIENSGKKIFPIQQDLDSSVPDLHLSIEETHMGLSGQWKYNSGLFREETIKRISGHFQNLLSGIAANPAQHISALPLLGTFERNQVLFEWNNTHADYPDDKCIHQLFEDQVKRTPDAVAVEVYKVPGSDFSPGKKEIAYYELNTRANQLAHYLRDLGVGPEILVGICVKRSFEMVTGVLGILKAGGAYLPLDPDYPKERLEFMIKDSGVSVLLTEQELLTELPSHNARMVCLDSEWFKISKCGDDNLVSGVNPENLAYVIYTSGSTGVPKGTLIVHRGVVNYLTWCIKSYALSKGSGAPINSSIAFDATVTSFFSPLLSGKRVLLLPEVNEIAALSEVLASENHFSLIKITPAHLEVLRHLLPAVQTASQVNALVIGGEALLAKSLEFWRKNFPATRLINEYGPTETVVGCCTYEVPDHVLSLEEVSIGRPIANTQIYILDRNMEPVPVGVSGEIYIGGAGLARGYHNQPQLTEKRFIANPFRDDPGARLYKTGDLACYMADGNIIFQGRIDQQVKIRGYRIELGEIESVLGNHHAVQHVAVMAREDTPGDKHLVAYLVTKGQTPAINELRLFLGEKLPEYMVPAIFVFLNALPLTSNGKVDRKALPAPDHKRVALENEYIAPRDNIELQLAAIFEKHLSIERVGITDDFFELGGSSIQAAIIFSQIQKITGKKLPLSKLIFSPTIEKLAVAIRANVEEEEWSSLVALQPKGSRPPLFCVHGGWGNVLFYRHLAKHMGIDQPLYGLQPKGLSGNVDPYYSIEEMAALYILEIRKVQPKGPYYIAGYCFGAIAAFEMAKQLFREGDKIAFLGSFNGVAPVNTLPLNGNRRKSNKHLGMKNRLLNPLREFKKKLRRGFTLGRFRVEIKIRALCYKFYFVQGRKLPESLRRFYIVDAMLIAQDKYDPRPYSGDLIIFRSPKIFRYAHLGWTNLISGNIKTIDISGNHHNRTRIMYEPFVQILADELKKHFEEISHA